MTALAARPAAASSSRHAPVLAALALATAAAGAGCERDLSLPLTSPIAAASVVELEPPPAMPEGMFPCSDCHEPDLPVNTTVRKLTTAHQEIELRHGGSTALWCFDCHDVKSRDQLRGPGGTLVAYDQAERLCGTCHGAQLRDWEHNAHGRRTGSFYGTATQKRCVHCHDAHVPHFADLQPKPAPKRPERTR